MDEHTISPAGDPFTAGDQDHPHCCNDGWVSMDEAVVNEETGEEEIEHALYLCRRCKGEA